MNRLWIVNKKELENEERTPANDKRPHDNGHHADIFEILIKGSSSCCNLVGLTQLAISCRFSSSMSNNEYTGVHDQCYEGWKGKRGDAETVKNTEF